MTKTRNTWVQICWLCCMMFLFGSLVQAQVEQQTFEKANEAYTNSEFQQAIDKYESLYEAGYRSTALFYNLGNAHYKLGHIAPAILNYERALKLDPSFEDAAFNLRLANLRVVDNLKPVPRLFLVEWFQQWFSSRSSGQWASLAVILLWIALFLGAGFLFLNNAILKRIGFFGGLLLLLAAALSAGISWQRLAKENNPDTGPAIIYSPNAYIKDAPDGSTDLLILHEGVKVQMEERVGGWVKISLNDANIGDVVGFVEASTIEKI